MSTLSKRILITNIPGRQYEAISLQMCLKKTTQILVLKIQILSLSGQPLAQWLEYHGCYKYFGVEVGSLLGFYKEFLHTLWRNWYVLNIWN